MKHYFAILGWTVGVWAAISICFGLSFPGVMHWFRGGASGPSGYSSLTESLVLFGPMCAGVIAFALGLMGLLPGTNPKDDEDN
ncbi:MAG: hypothetical protein ACKODH_11440 [Limisphaerales bacterium]